VLSEVASQLARSVKAIEIKMAELKNGGEWEQIMRA
jgi:hypothetical protein